MIEKKRGHYLGTEIDEKWWRRYRKEGFLASGLGEYWVENPALFFYRHLTTEPIVIPLNDIVEVKLGKWHSGSWAGGKSVVKVLWEKDNKKLCSGFVFSPNKQETEIMADKIRSYCRKNK